jgi:hypothetical protein
MRQPQHHHAICIPSTLTLHYTHLSSSLHSFILLSWYNRHSTFVSDHTNATQKQRALLAPAPSAAATSSAIKEDVNNSKIRTISNKTPSKQQLASQHFPKAHQHHQWKDLSNIKSNLQDQI